jgi:DNA-binding CsgD family transcriptional regulator
MTADLQMSHRSLLLAQRCLLDVYGETDRARLRKSMLRCLAQVIEGDHASFNEMDLVPGQHAVAPDPLPPWWRQLGEVFRVHTWEHPLLHRPQLNRAVLFSDSRVNRRWNKSTLRNDYFQPLGVRDQVSNLIFHEGTRWIGIAVNRNRGSFGEGARALLELLGRHFGVAWRNAQRFAAIGAAGGHAPRELAGGGAILVAWSSPRGAVRALTPEAEVLLARHGATRSGSRRMRDEIGRWLQAELARLQFDVIRGGPPIRLTLPTATGDLAARLVAVRGEETIVLLEELRAPAEPRRNSLPSLTRREGEILAWIADGKRNAEIALILGISARTVEKHVEHLFAKLGVETRTAAMRLALDSRRLSHA